jgi:hypothetical protein
MAVVAAGLVLLSNIEATLVPERTQRRSLAEQRKLSGDDIQYLLGPDGSRCSTSS